MRGVSVSGIAAGLALGGALFLGAVSSGAAPGQAEGENAQPSPEQLELIAAHNRERAAANLPPLVANPKLEAAARAHARDMAEHGTMTHEGSDGSTFDQRIKRQGYEGRR